MAIRYLSEQTNYTPKHKRKISTWVNHSIEKEGFTPGDITFIFCGGDKHLEINRTYLGHDYATDVITFDYTEGETKVLSGDIFIDPVTVKDNASLFGASFRDEMLRVLIHGIMHLCGYGDKTPAEEKIMREKEDEYIRLYLKENAL